MNTFNLMTEPKQYVLTIHLTNMINTYGSKKTIEQFKLAFKNEAHPRIQQIVDYCGKDTCAKFFTEVYGWKFNKKAA